MCHRGRQARRVPGVAADNRVMPASTGREETCVRQYPRVTASLRASWHQKHVHCATRLTNLSAGGCFIRSLDPEPPIGLLRLHLRLPENVELWVSGRVAHTQAGQGFGVRFLDVAARDQITLSHAVAQLAP